MAEILTYRRSQQPLSRYIHGSCSCCSLHLLPGHSPHPCFCCSRSQQPDGRRKTPAWPLTQPVPNRGGEHAAFAITLPARWRCSAVPANRIRTQLGGLPLSVTPMICHGDMALLRPLEILPSNAALGIHGSVPDAFLASLSTGRRSRLALVISQHQKTNPR